VPQHGLPAVGQRLERLGDQLLVGPGQLGRVGLVADRLGHLVDRPVRRLLPLLGRQATEGDEQVGPERLGRSRPPPQRPQHPLEGAVDQVLGVAHALVRGRQPVGGGLMTDVQLGERRLVATARLSQELGIGERRDRHVLDL
jgi:hypothetical protein